MDPTLLVLAQTTEAAEAGVSIVQTIINGGAALILAVAVVVIGWAYWKQLKRNNDLEKDFREKIESDGGKRLVDQEKLLREQIDREREAQETVAAAVQAIEGFSHKLSTIQTAGEATQRACEALSVKLDDVIGRLRDVESTLRRRLGDA